MDRRQLLGRAAQSGEERVLLAHILDKCEQSRQRNIPAATDFLSPAEQRAAQELLHAAAIHEGYAFRGGYERAERKMLFFLPDWQEEADESESMTALRCTYRKEDTLTHRDFLGALMGCGVKRETVGDIYVAEGRCDFLVTREVLPYLLQNFLSAGRTKLHVEQIALTDVSVPEQKTKMVRDTVPSLRLDGIVSSGFSISRGKAADYISAGKCELNYTPCVKGDKQTTEGDVITVRGLGKIRLDTIGSNTKKGRIGVEITRFL